MARWLDERGSVEMLGEVDTAAAVRLDEARTTRRRAVARLLRDVAVAGGGVRAASCSAARSHGKGGRGAHRCDRGGKVEMQRSDGAVEGDGPGTAGRVENNEGKKAWRRRMGKLQGERRL
jgi:hypothetical protein